MFDRKSIDVFLNSDFEFQDTGCGRLKVRRFLLACLKVLVSGLLVWFLLSQIGVGRIIQTLVQADPRWMWAGILLFTASHFVGNMQWDWLLKAEGIRLSWLKCLSIYFIGLFFNNFLIGGIGGDVFRMLDVRRLSGKGSGAVSAVFLDRLIGLFAMTGIGVAAMPFALSGRSYGPLLWIAFAVLTAGWGFCLFFLFHKPFARVIIRLIQFLIPRRIETRAREVYGKINTFGSHRGLLARALGLSVAVQLMRIYTHYLVGRALGASLSPAVFFLVVPIVALAASLPISVGGIGLREQSGAVLFGAAGMMRNQAVTMEFLVYLVAILSSLPGGAVFILGKRGKRKQ
jgi:glycosyltransferase 2 family protein